MTDARSDELLALATFVQSATVAAEVATGGEKIHARATRGGSRGPRRRQAGELLLRRRGE